MYSKSTRLDRFISIHSNLTRRDVRIALAKKRITVDGTFATDINQVIDQFSNIVLDNIILQNNSPVYLMMHKPRGIVSATKDDKNKTVIDLLKKQTQVDPSSLPIKDLHIVGRLDFNSSGMLLLTNDGRWSRCLSSPEHSIIKRYWVRLEKPVNEEYIRAFKQGMYFAYEDITTRSVNLRILDSHTAEVELTEGKYHQIRRMFGRFQNEVLELQRIAIGNLELDIAPENVRSICKEDVYFSQTDNVF